MTNQINIQINKIAKLKTNFNLKSFIKSVLLELQIKTGLFEFNFIPNSMIKDLNKKYLSHDTFTDVITFNLGTPQNITGDIYISVDQAKINAKKFKNPFNEEIKLLIVHAILHLLDYQDYTDIDRQKMDQKQNQILASIKNKQKQKTIHQHPKLLKSFELAIKGILYTIYSERHMKIHLFFTLVGIILGFICKISINEWMILFITISIVLISETINTALEVTVDLATRKQRIRAKLAKDMAAGAVLISSINSLIIAYLLFFHKLVILFFRR